MTADLHLRSRLQRRLSRLLHQLADDAGYVARTCFNYRPQSDKASWVADVACLSGVRSRSIDKCLEGSPEVTAIIKCSEESDTELYERALTTLAGSGAKEFWIVDGITLSVTCIPVKLNYLYHYTLAKQLAVPVPMFGGRVYLEDLFDGWEVPAGEQLADPAGSKSFDVTASVTAHPARRFELVRHA